MASRVQGYVVELNVDAGDHVKKGQVLLRLDAKEMVEREAQAKAALESAAADLVETRNDFERYKVLFEKQAVAKKDYDDALARYDVAQAAEARAQAALDEAKTHSRMPRLLPPLTESLVRRTSTLVTLQHLGANSLQYTCPAQSNW